MFKNKKTIILQSLFVFIVTFFGGLITQKLYGFKSTYDFPSHPGSWDEIINHIPADFLISISFTVFSLYIFWNIDKQNKTKENENEKKRKKKEKKKKWIKNKR